MNPIYKKAADLATDDYRPLPLHGGWHCEEHPAEFIATVEGVDLWRRVGDTPEGSFVAILAAHDCCVAFNDKTPRHLLPAGPIGDYIHSYRQLIR